MVRLPELGEIEAVLKNIELGFWLEDREIWICKEFLGRLREWTKQKKISKNGGNLYWKKY